MKMPADSLTPLEILTRTNSELLAKRKRPAPPIKPSAEVERYYRVQLRSLVRAMAKEIAAEVLPVIRAERRQYIGDDDDLVESPSGGWVSRVLEAIRKLSERYTGQMFERQ